jgi:hypothetical protein
MQYRSAVLREDTMITLYLRDNISMTHTHTHTHTHIYIYISVYSILMIIFLLPMALVLGEMSL